MSETRKYCCCGLFSLEHGSVIIGIFNLLIPITAYIGMIHIPLDSLRKGVQDLRLDLDSFTITRYIEIASIIVLNDIGLSVLFTPILIYGISKEESAYFLPWVTLYILKIIAVSNF